MTDVALGLVRLGFAPLRDFIVQDDSDARGPRLVAWLSSQPRPSPTEIEAAASQPDQDQP